MTTQEPNFRNEIIRSSTVEEKWESYTVKA